MTAKRDRKRKPKKVEPPKVKNEKLKDLSADKGSGTVRGGAGCRTASIPW